MYVKNSIAKGVSKLPFSHSDILWVRLEHIFLVCKETSTLQ